MSAFLNKWVLVLGDFQEKVQGYSIKDIKSSNVYTAYHGGLKWSLGFKS